MLFTSVIMTSAIAPVAADIIAGRPPANAVTTAMQKDAYRPTFGSTPVIMENAMASGIRASATTVPASNSGTTFGAHSLRRFLNFIKRVPASGTRCGGDEDE